MKLKTLAMGGVAIVGLALAAPAAAFTHHPSTPAEQKQTDDLNAQQLAQVQQQSATTTTVAGGASSASTAQAQNAPADQTATNATAQTQSAPTDQAAANATAQTQSAPTDQTAANTTESTTSASGAAPATGGTVALAQIANPPQTLINASVETNNGQAVGAVQKVVTGSDGKAQAVDVALLGAQSKIVSIDAAQLSYDQSRNVVVAQLSADQIQALPATPQG